MNFGKLIDCVETEGFKSQTNIRHQCKVLCELGFCVSNLGRDSIENRKTIEREMQFGGMVSSSTSFMSPKTAYRSLSNSSPL